MRKQKILLFSLFLLFSLLFVCLLFSSRDMQNIEFADDPFTITKKLANKHDTSEKLPVQNDCIPSNHEISRGLCQSKIQPESQTFQNRSTSGQIVSVQQKCLAPHKDSLIINRSEKGKVFRYHDRNYLAKKKLDSSSDPAVLGLSASNFRARSWVLPNYGKNIIGEATGVNPVLSTDSPDISPSIACAADGGSQNPMSPDKNTSEKICNTTDNQGVSPFKNALREKNTKIHDLFCDSLLVL